MVQKSMEVQLDNGLEARPVAVFVQVASQHLRRERKQEGKCKEYHGYDESRT